MADFPLFYKVKIEEHDFIKEWFLDNYQDYIDSLDNRTDYYENLKREPPYLKEWVDYSRKYIKQFARFWGIEDYNYDVWCAQYENGQEHEWHIHPKSHFAVVYNLDLPYNQNSTELWKKDFYSEEGDLIFFPAFWIHRSAPNIFEQRKTVLAGNLVFNDYAFLP